MGKRCSPYNHAAAEKIIRQELQRLGAPSRFLVVPAKAQRSLPRRWPRLWQAAFRRPLLANPLVQRAREIFKPKCAASSICGRSKIMRQMR